MSDILSDKTIKRDGKYSFPYRFLVELRKRVAPLFRKKLNVSIEEELEGIEFTIFSNNCLGGVFYHDANRRFTSPTVNTAMDGEDFLRFVENPKKYLSAPMNFFTFPGHNYPIAQIEDIEVRFVHYKTPEEAETKWRERAERIVWDNIFIIATNHDGCGDRTIMERFNKLTYENKIMFVSNSYSQYPWAVEVPQFRGRFQVKIMTAFANFKGQRYYETCFDIPKWIKECTKNRI